jgi:hypothetical protein
MQHNDFAPHDVHFCTSAIGGVILIFTTICKTLQIAAQSTGGGSIPSVGALDDEELEGLEEFKRKIDNDEADLESNKEIEDSGPLQVRFHACTTSSSKGTVRLASPRLFSSSAKAANSPCHIHKQARKQANKRT